MNTSSHLPGLVVAGAVALCACGPVASGEGRVAAPNEAPVHESERRAEHDDASARDGDRDDPEANADEGAKPYELDPLVIEVDPETGEVVAYDARALLDAGNDALQGGDAALAIAYYDKLVDEFPEARLVAAALYNGGLALERLGDHDAAIARYRQLAAREETGRDAIDATIRAGAVMAELGRWPAAIEMFDDLLARDDLTPSDRVEGHARLGYVLYENKSYPRAEEVLRAGLAVADDLGEGEHLETTYFVAMTHFYLGMIPRRQFSEIPLRLPDDQLERDIEAKAELVLLAHERLSRAIRARNPHWATAAGYELGAMQEEFWREIVSAPIPPHLEPRAVEVYVEEVHRQAREFLERALNLYSKTVELADEYRTATRWSRAAEARAGAVAELLARERAGDLVTPTRDTQPPATATAGADWDVTRYIPARVDL